MTTPTVALAALDPARHRALLGHILTTLDVLAEHGIGLSILMVDTTAASVSVIPRPIPPADIARRIFTALGTQPRQPPTPTGDNTVRLEARLRDHGGISLRLTATLTATAAPAADPREA